MSKASLMSMGPFERLGEVIEKLDNERGTHYDNAYYLAISSTAFEQVCQQLSKHGLAQAEGEKWGRVVIETPLGPDLESVRVPNGIVESVFPSDAVFRIDHYVGKETVQNILAPALCQPVLYSAVERQLH